MAEGALVGVWWDAAGQFRGTYVLCHDCATVTLHGTQEQRNAVAERVEFELASAGAELSREVH
ncbi:MAG: hypothetical protein AB1346_00450 [Thermodesulfobacteriota bacterium]